MKQLGQLQEIEPQLKEMGYQIIAISPDKPEELKKTIEKEKLTYQLLSDSKMEASQAFGIAFVNKSKMLTKILERASGEKHHQLPVPSVFIVGKDGVIKFVHFDPNYRKRIEPDALIAAAKEALE